IKLSDEVAVMVKFEYYLHRTLGVIIFITSTIMIVGVIIQVILRSFFDTSITWMEEFSRYMFIWSAFIGASIASRNSTHPKMELLMDKLPQKIRKYYLFILQILIIIFLLSLTYFGFKLMTSPTVTNQ